MWILLSIVIVRLNILPVHTRNARNKDRFIFSLTWFVKNTYFMKVFVTSLITRKPWINNLKYYFFSISYSLTICKNFILLECQIHRNRFTFEYQFISIDNVYEPIFPMLCFYSIDLVNGHGILDIFSYQHCYYNAHTANPLHHIGRYGLVANRFLNMKRKLILFLTSD